MKMTKLDLAKVQVDKAILLFLEEEYVCSLTLAGAAEEMLGQLCRRAGKTAAVDFVVDFHLSDVDDSLSEKEARSLITRLLNGTRNQVKHANDENEDIVEIEQVHPLQMLMRAIPMAEKLGVKLEYGLAMRKWIHDHPEALK